MICYPNFDVNRFRKLFQLPDNGLQKPFQR